MLGMMPRYHYSSVRSSQLVETQVELYVATHADPQGMQTNVGGWKMEYAARNGHEMYLAPKRACALGSTRLWV